MATAYQFGGCLQRSPTTPAVLSRRYPCFSCVPPGVYGTPGAAIWFISLFTLPRSRGLSSRHRALEQQDSLRQGHVQMHRSPQGLRAAAPPPLPNRWPQPPAAAARREASRSPGRSRAAPPSQTCGISGVATSVRQSWRIEPVCRGNEEDPSAGRGNGASCCFWLVGATALKVTLKVRNIGTR